MECAENKILIKTVQVFSSVRQKEKVLTFIEMRHFKIHIDPKSEIELYSGKSKHSLQRLYDYRNTKYCIVSGGKELANKCYG